MSREDAVTPELHAAVLVRDRRCIRAKMEPGHGCRDRWGNPHAPDALEYLTLDHIQDGYGRMGKRAPSDLAHLVSLCWDAHLGGWATSHRPELRAYLERVNKEELSR